MNFETFLEKTGQGYKLPSSVDTVILPYTDVFNAVVAHQTEHLQNLTKLEHGIDMIDSFKPDSEHAYCASHNGPAYNYFCSQNVMSPEDPDHKVIEHAKIQGALQSCLEAIETGKKALKALNAIQAASFDKARYKDQYSINDTSVKIAKADETMTETFMRAHGAGITECWGEKTLNTDMRSNVLYQIIWQAEQKRAPVLKAA